MPLSLSSVPLLAAMLLQQVAVAPKLAAPPSTIFRSADLHFDYAYDSTLTNMASIADDAMQSEKDKSTGVLKSALACLSLPLTAIDSGGGLRMVMIMRLSGTCLGTEIPPAKLADLANSTLSQSLARFGTATLSAPGTYAVAGHNAATISGTVKSDKFGMTFTGVSTCMVQGKDAVCWELMVSDCARLPALMASPVTFEGQPPVALIPEKYAPTCKP